MAIVFPRPLPDVGFLAARFVLNDGVTASPAGAGLINFSQVNDPAWSIAFTSKPLREGALAELTAWWASLRGGIKSALVSQNVTCRPKAHARPADAAPAQDPGNLVSIANGNQLSINGVSVALVLTAGDLIGLEYGGFYGLARVTDVSGTGTTSRAVTVEPPPRSYVGVAGAVVRFENPKLIMRPAPKSWSMSDGSRPSVSFSLVEHPS